MNKKYTKFFIIELKYEKKERRKERKKIIVHKSGGEVNLLISLYIVSRIKPLFIIKEYV